MNNALLIHSELLLLADYRADYSKTWMLIYRHVHIYDLEMTPVIGIILGAVGAALLDRMMKGSFWPLKNPTKMGSGSKDKVIETDDYEVLD